MDEYSTEKFIEHYEHIKKLQLLTDEELSKLKRKREKFEIVIKSANNPQSFIEYIEFELVLLKKLSQQSYENENAERAMDLAMTQHIKGIFRRALRRFQDDRQLWSLHLKFLKQKSRNKVTSTYQEMLAFHHESSDYIEAAEFEMERKNFYSASTFLVQGMNCHKNSSKLVTLFIECSIRQSEEADEKMKETTLTQVTKFFENFLKEKAEIDEFVELLKKIQDIRYSLPFQNTLIAHIVQNFYRHPELWKLMADRALAGYFYKDDEHKAPEDTTFEDRLRQALSIYTKSLDVVDSQYKSQMYGMYLDELVELNNNYKILNPSQRKLIKGEIQQRLKDGYLEELLPEKYFIIYICQRLTNNSEAEDFVTKGLRLFPHSLDFYEIAFKFMMAQEDYEGISNLFKKAVQVNEKNVFDLYKLLVHIYSQNIEDKARVTKAMIEAINNVKNKQTSAELQAYMIEHSAAVDGIDSTRKMYHKILNSKHAINLSLKFFENMITIEKSQSSPDHGIIRSCFERATMMFGRESPELWIKYIHYNWDHKMFCEADSVRKRAMEALKDNSQKVKSFLEMEKSLST